MKIAGFPGALVATLGCIIPSCIIVSFLAWIYYKYKEMTVIQGVLSGLRPAVVAMIASAGLSIFALAIWGTSGFSTNLQTINYISLLLFAVVVFILRRWKPSPILMMLGSGVIGGTIYLIL